MASAELFGVSMALGAFLAGLVVGRSEFSVRAAADALPMRDAFAVLFFVSVGMLLDPGTLLDDPLMLAATLGVVLIGKPLAALAIVALLGYPLKVALSVAIALAQIGEFSFIVAAVASDYGVLTADATNILVAAAIASITINPLLFRAIGWFERGLTRGPPGTNVAAVEDRGSAVAFRAIVVGYGPVGRTVARLLRDNAIEPTIIEMNVDTVREVGAAGLRGIYGDATHPAVLAEAGIAEARAFIIAVSPLEGVEEACRLARSQNPGVRILARASHAREVAQPARGRRRRRLLGRRRACAGVHGRHPRAARRDRGSDRSRARPRPRRVGLSARPDLFSREAVDRRALDACHEAVRRYNVADARQSIRISDGQGLSQLQPRRRHAQAACSRARRPPPVGARRARRARP